MSCARGDVSTENTGENIIDPDALRFAAGCVSELYLRNCARITCTVPKGGRIAESVVKYSS